MTDHTKLHNPEYIGPGTWNTIHTLATWATTPEKKIVLIEQIKYIQQKFPCLKCKEHFGKYIEAHPMEPTINGNEEALFLWTFNFHNTVNHRLNKPKITYEDAKTIYYTNSIVCSADCDEEPSNNKPKIVPREFQNRNGYNF